MFGSDISNLRLFDRENRSITELGLNLCVSTVDENKSTLTAHLLIRILNYRGSEIV